MDEITAAPDQRPGHGGEPIVASNQQQLAHDVQHAQDDAPRTLLDPNLHDPTLDFREETVDLTSNFAFSPNQLHGLLTTKTLPALRAFGGLLGLAAGLRTDISAGLSVDETNVDGTVTFDEAVAAGLDGRPPTIVDGPPPPTPPTLLSQGLRLGEHRDDHYADRKRIFGKNLVPQRKQKSFLMLMWIAFNDKLIILLTISATISLAIGIYQTVDPSVDSSRTEWVDGVTIVAAIAVIVVASAATDWQKNQKFKRLNERKDQRDVTVFRSGRHQTISVYDVLVGDLLHVEAGDVVAADGVLVQSSWLLIDESSISGESDLVHKTVPSDNDPLHTTHADPFIHSGTTVARGVGRYLVTAVGLNSSHGRVLASLRSDVEETPLQAKLGRLGKQLIIIGAIAGSIFFLILFIRYLVNIRNLHVEPSQKVEDFLHVLILSITVVVITVPEGLALNVTIALAFATKRMLKDNNLVRLLRSCEIMGNATTVCSDKTGTLTQNKMTVVTGRIGLQCYFDDTDLAVSDLDISVSRASTIKCDTSAQLMTTLSDESKALIKDIVAVNSTAFESDDPGSPGFIGSSTETALLEFSRHHLGMRHLVEERANCPVVTMLPFDSSRKWMASLIKLPNGMYRLLVKGAAEVVFEYCAFIVSDPTYRLPRARLSEDDRASFHNTIQDYASKLLRPVAMAYQDFHASEVFENPDDDPESVNLEWLASGMVFLGIFGIRDPLRPEVVDSVRKCQAAGVFVRMVTGDNFLTAKAIAAECGIYTAGGIAMDGPTFRDLTSEQLDAVIPRLQVLARSSPEDKLLLVSHLKGMNETAAVTGDGSNDALALKAADVGFAMGIQGTEVAKEAASIILLDDKFASIVKALAWGRAVNDAVKQFCQFQFTINLTAGIITVVSELVGDAIFTVVQLLWINLIMDIFASLGLATDHPSPDVLRRKPEPRNAPIVSITMWKMIIGQAIYQLAVVFVVHYAGWDLFNPDTEFEVEKLQTFVFNIYVWMQFFNQHNCRRVDNKLDIYQGVWKNPWFIAVQLITVAGQFTIIFKGGEAFDTRSLTGAQWGWSILFGILTIPLGALIRQVPDSVVQGLFDACRSGYHKAIGPFRGCLSSVIPKRFKKRKDEQPDAEMGPVENIIQTLGLGPGSEDQDVTTTADQRAALESSARLRRQETERQTREIDLKGLIEAARLGREYGNSTLELHPRTLKDDPVLRAKSGSTLPPSRDAAFMRFVAVNRGGHRMHVRSPMSQLSRNAQHQQQTQRQPQPPTRRSSGFKWESLLRSKRR
ncbi:hypothetical protein EDB81DRAFT_282823 [Dactylonectria macrodidyma]|uniref:Calcium-transporting ATPase n=1 Tax=Dactylonectria macrodidyma TaxID=307937 RepID=A0A9P9FNN6_9HYPO|nr:hypothetical protein EDB81DRAFT_282823 [Dactylonectria macrodidyma]